MIKERLFCFEYFPERGLTLIEVLIVIAVSLIILSAAIPIYGNLQVSTQLNEESAYIVQTLRLARGRSTNRVDGASWGVYFELRAEPLKDRYILYQGNSFAARNPAFDRTRELAAGLSLELPGEASSYDFHFNGLGEITNPGSMMLRHQVSGVRAITINALGIVCEQ